MTRRRDLRRRAQFIGQVELDRLLDVEPRVARCLAEMFDPYLYPQTQMEVQISQEEIGYLSGIFRQRVNQTLEVLEREERNRVEYGGIHVPDLPRLRSFGG